MLSFGEIVLRLKQRLGVESDRALAAVLGLSEKAFNARKTRGSFPEDKLRAAAQQHPEWHLDVDFVLTGHSAREDEFERRLRLIRIATAKAQALAIPDRERALVRDIFWGVEMGASTHVMMTLDAYIGERLSTTRSGSGESAQQEVKQGAGRPAARAGKKTQRGEKRR